ncbi:hypothetical protein [Rhizobium sp. NRK18]|uniref:hypothetical protein n=1 Tax=Rhizobium sp. NRK18 TaxID=2964667 RepID=UPI0021C257D2|nr:hypothetical protein [Rhizobium sp. NRK18]MCQ2004966.1 hypothetical protein [Rhizobium sp. NRK18]
MFRLAAILYVLIASTLAGIGVVAVVSMSMMDARSIVTAAVVGAIIALPVTWLVARRISVVTSR